MRQLLFFSTLLFLCSQVQASDQHQQHGSKHTRQEHQVIKSLSSDDIAVLKQGGGWGLAKAAELNGVPGPKHLLELKKKIPLDASQIKRITKVYEQMKTKAIKQGEKLILLEKELGYVFQSCTITDEMLDASLTEIAEVRKELRYIHLSAHLKMPEVLSQKQIARYNMLRGYSD